MHIRTQKQFNQWKIIQIRFYLLFRIEKRHNELLLQVVNGQQWITTANGEHRMNFRYIFNPHFHADAHVAFKW